MGSSFQSKGVFVLVHEFFVLVQEVFVLVHGIFVLVHGVLGLESSFLGLRFRNTRGARSVKQKHPLSFNGGGGGGEGRIRACYQ